MSFPSFHSSWPAPNGLRADVEKQAQRLGIKLRIVLETNSLADQTELAACGGAYTIAGHTASQRLIAGLQASRIVDPSIVRTIAMGIASRRLRAKQPDTWRDTPECMSWESLQDNRDARRCTMSKANRAQCWRNE